MHVVMAGQAGLSAHTAGQAVHAKKYRSTNYQTLTAQDGCCMLRRAHHEVQAGARVLATSTEGTPS